MNRKVNSVAIEAICKGKAPIFFGDNGLNGDEKLVLWLLPNGIFAIETNGDPIFEDELGWCDAILEISTAECVI